MKKILTMMLVMIFTAATFAIAGTVKDAGKDAVNYTGNVANESVQTVGRAAKGTGETAVSPFKKFWNWATGKGKGSEIVTDPINRAGCTVSDAAKDTVNVPYNAAKKTASQR